MKNILSVFNDNKYPILGILLLLPTFGYSIIRSIWLPLTHDEAISYIIHASASWMDILQFSEPIMSNNHLLNTLLIKLFTGLLGNSEGVIRLPALIGHGIYLTGIYLIGGLLFKKYYFLLGLIFLSYSPFLLDFFSCARGYSLALGFFIFGFYYYLKGIRTTLRTDIGMGLSGLNSNYSNQIFLFITLSVLANLPFMNVYMTLVFMLICRELYRYYYLKNSGQSNNLRLIAIYYRLIQPMAISILFLIIIYSIPLWKMLQENEFYYGGITGFWSDTVLSLVRVLIYNRSLDMGWWILLGLILIVFFLIYSIVYLIIRYWKNKNLDLEEQYLFSVLGFIILCSLGIELQNIIFDTRYVIERMAIYYIPIFLVLILLTTQFGYKAIRYLISGFILLLSIYFLTGWNVQYYYSWKYDSTTRCMIYKLKDKYAGVDMEPDSIRLGIDWHYEPSINYYRKRYNLYWLAKVDRTGPENEFDYYYLYRAWEKNQNLIDKYELVIIQEFPLSNSILAARKK